jgi:hypothetical protein
MAVACFILLALTVVHSWAETDILKLDKTSYRPGEEIQVRFRASRYYPANAWVGIIPSRVPHGSEEENDKHDISYQYLNKRTKGTLLFRAPDRTGSYDFRMHDTDNNGREICSVSFQVTSYGDKSFEQDRDLPRPGMTLVDSKSFRPGDPIRVRFKTPYNWPQDAWIGIIPSTVPHGSEAENDRYDISYQYLKGRTDGVLTFIAPRRPGVYDLRMHDTDGNGREVKHITFKVVP